MNWEMIGAIGEVVGAIAVVVTLAYLARQIRMSNEASRRAAMQELLDQSHLVASQLSGDERLADIWGRGLADFEGLTSTEQIRLRALLHQLTLILERYFYLDQGGGLAPWIVELNDQILRDVAGTPGYRAWFATRRHWYGDEFGAVIEQAMSQSSGFDTRFVGEDTQASPQEGGTAATEA